MLGSVLGGCHVPGKAVKFLQWQNTARKTWDGRQTEHVPKTETECPSWAKGKRTDKQNSADSTGCAGRAQQTVGITGEWLAAAVCWGERKVQWVGCTRGGGRSGIGKRDIANKGDIVWDADDSRAAAQPESACDTSSLKPSPALSSSDLFCSPSTPLSSSSFQTEERVALLYFFPLRSPRIRADTFSFLSSFSSRPRADVFAFSVLMQCGWCCHQSRMYI